MIEQDLRSRGPNALAHPVDDGLTPARRGRLDIAVERPGHRDDHRHHGVFRAEDLLELIAFEVAVEALLRRGVQVLPHGQDPVQHAQAEAGLFPQGHGLDGTHAAIQKLEAIPEHPRVREEPSDPRLLRGKVLDELLAQPVRLAGQHVVEGLSLVATDPRQGSTLGGPRAQVLKQLVAQPPGLTLVQPLNRRIEDEPPPLEARQISPRPGLGLHHHHAQSSPGQKRPRREPGDPGADNRHVHVHVHVRAHVHAHVRVHVRGLGLGDFHHTFTIPSPCLHHVFRHIPQPPGPAHPPSRAHAPAPPRSRTCTPALTHPHLPALPYPSPRARAPPALPHPTPLRSRTPSGRTASATRNPSSRPTAIANKTSRPPSAPPTARAVRRPPRVPCPPPPRRRAVASPALRRRCGLARPTIGTLIHAASVGLGLVADGRRGIPAPGSVAGRCASVVTSDRYVWGSAEVMSAQ